MATRFSIAIVGGGIGGLFAANALLARGLRVAVYEQAPAIGEIGAGVYVTPNAVRHLQSVGLGGAVYFAATSPTAGAEIWKSDGTTAGTVMLRDINPGVAGSNSMMSASTQAWACSCFTMASVK